MTPSNSLRITQTTNAFDGRRIRRMVQKIAVHRYGKRAEMHGFRLPEWPEQQPKQSEQKS